MVGEATKTFGEFPQALSLAGTEEVAVWMDSGSGTRLHRAATALFVGPTGATGATGPQGDPGSFQGNLLYKTGDQTITAGAATSIIWDAESFTTQAANELWNSGDPTKLIHANGVDYLQIEALVVVSGVISASQIEFWIGRSGSDSWAVPGASRVINASTLSESDTLYIPLKTPVIPAADGEYFQIRIQSTGANVDVLSGVTKSFAQIAMWG